MKVKPLFTTITPCFAALFLVSCFDDSADKNSKAAATPSEESAKTEAKQPSEADIKTFVLGGDSKIAWHGTKGSGALAGGFSNFVGKFEVADSKLVAGGKHFITVDMASVFSDDASFTTQLKTDQFFDVAKYPIARFQLKEAVQKEGDNYEISGVLDMHGMAKKITFPATMKISEKETLLDINADIAINRQDFGISFAGNPDELIQDEVTMKLSVSALPGEPVELVLMDKTEEQTPSGDGRPSRGKGGDKGWGGKGDGVDWRNMSEAEREERRKQMMTEMDKNKDGQLGKDELPERVWSFMSRADKDGDEKLSEAERNSFRDEMRAERELRELTGEGGGFPGRDGDRGGDRGPGKGGPRPDGKSE